MTCVASEPGLDRVGIYVYSGLLYISVNWGYGDMGIRRSFESEMNIHVDPRSFVFVSCSLMRPYN